VNTMDSIAQRFPTLHHEVRSVVPNRFSESTITSTIRVSHPANGFGGGGGL